MVPVSLYLDFNFKSIFLTTSVAPSSGSNCRDKWCCIAFWNLCIFKDLEKNWKNAKSIFVLGSIGRQDTKHNDIQHDDIQNNN